GQRLSDGDRLDTLVAFGRIARDICRVEIRAGSLAEGLRLDPDWRTRAWQRRLLGDGNAAGTNKPQERNQEPHERISAGIIAFIYGMGLQPKTVAARISSRNRCVGQSGG